MLHFFGPVGHAGAATDRRYFTRALLAVWWGATLWWLLAVFPPTFAEELLSFLYSVGLRIKIRHLWWPKLCQTMFTLSLLTKPFSKLVRRHAVLVYSFNF